MMTDEDSVVAFQSIKLTISAVNQPPVFSMTQFNFSLPEGSSDDTVVGSVLFTNEGMCVHVV